MLGEGQRTLSHLSLPSLLTALPPSPLSSFTYPPEAVEGREGTGKLGPVSGALGGDTWATGQGGSRPSLTTRLAGPELQ